MACAPHTSKDGSASNYRERCIITELLEDTFYVDLALNIMEWYTIRRVAVLIHVGQSRHLRIVRGRKKSIPEPPLKDILFARLYDKHNQRLERKIADLKQFPLEDHEKLQNMIIEEVTKEYHTEYAALVVNGEP